MRSAAQGVLATLHRIFEIGLHALRLTPTIGTVLAALDGTELNVLLRKDVRCAGPAAPLARPGPTLPLLAGPG